MKKNQEKQDEAAEKLVNDFIRRCNVADSILRYSFRLDMPDVRKMPKQENLVDWVGKSAYELFDPLVEDRRWRVELYVQAPLIILMEGWNFLRKMQLYTFIASCAN